MKHGFLGYGHLAQAIHKGYASDGVDTFFAYSRSRKTTGISHINSLEEMISSIDVLWICIRPQDMQSCLRELSQFNLNHLSIISPVAGHQINSIEEVVGKENHIIRIMPNIGVRYNQGLIAYTENKPGNRNIQEFLGKIGYVILLNENQFDKFTGIFGSGPGFLLEVLGVWHEKSIGLGMDSKESMKALSIFLAGLSKYLSDNIDSSPRQLVNEITTKGGTTEAGLNIYEDLMISNHLNLSIDAAINHCSNLKS